MTDALAVFGDSARSTDLFHAIPAVVTDPFLYYEAGGRRVALVSHIDQETIRAVAPDVELVDPMALGWRDLLRAGVDRMDATLQTASRALREAGVGAVTVSWDFPVALADRLRADGIEVRADHKAFELRRRVKTPAQLEGIRRAQRAADAAMGVAAGLVRECAEGLTSEAVRAAMQQECDGHGADLEDEVIVAVNGQAARGHDAGSGPIARGDVVLIDIWPRDRGSRCWADMTRTFIAGGEAPPEEIGAYWRLAREALEAATAAVRPGVGGADLHAVAAEVFERAGEPTLRTAEGAELPDHGFLHSLGHGVGLDLHEAPGLGLVGDPLVEGDVLAVEPGCYKQGLGGVRLEDLVLVTSAGCEVLTRFPYEL